MNEIFFHAKEMTVGYNGIPLIRDIEITLEKGEIVTLIGPNGAGKSTILKSIIGQLSLIDGSIAVENFDLGKMTEKERAKQISVVFTNRISPELMTCSEIVSLGRYPYTGRFGALSERDREKIREAMEIVHVSELSDKEFATLSDGQKQRVLLARAIAQEPEILVLDEPTSFLDIRNKLEFMSVLKELKEKKELTVIMSLHELDMAERVSDKVLCVKGEYIDRFGTVCEVFTSEYISEFYEVPKEELQSLGKWRMN